MATSAVLENLRRHAYIAGVTQALLDQHARKGLAVRPVYRESSTEVTPLATPRQESYLGDLMTRLATHAPSVHRDAAAWIDSLGRLDRTDASRAIAAVLRHLAAPAERTETPRPTPTVRAAADLRPLLARLTPDTRYAVEVGGEGSNDWRFYRLVETRVGAFRYLQVGHANGAGITWERLSVPAQLVAARRILADAHEAMLNFGRHLGRCGHCGRVLTNRASREAGIGPICAGK